MSSDYRTYALPAKQDPAETVQKNLSEVSKRQEPLHLARAFHLSELIEDLALSEKPDRDQLISLTERIFPSAQATTPYDSAVRHADLIALCHEIAVAYPDNYNQVFADLFGQNIPPSEQAQGRVAYVQNSYTEQAFMELTGFIKHRRVAYFHHFDDVCQEVRGGLCEYGILPVESTAEGLMAGLFRQIELYDLRICALCHIATTNEGYTSFALVRKTLAPIPAMPQYCLDFLCSPADALQIGELICIATLCGHTLQHTATYQSHDGETFRLRLGTNPEMLYPFLIYLTLFCADITPIGFYLIK